MKAKRSDEVETSMAEPGPRNLITDVPGLLVGQSEAVAGCTGRHSDASTPDVGVPIDARVSDAGARRVLFYPGIDCNPIADQRCLEPPSPISDEERFTSAPATEMEPPAGTEVVLSVRPIGD